MNTWSVARTSLKNEQRLFLVGSGQRRAACGLQHLPPAVQNDRVGSAS